MQFLNGFVRKECQWNTDDTDKTDWEETESIENLKKISRDFHMAKEKVSSLTK